MANGDLLTDILAQAIQAERDGYRFYLMAAQSTQDSKARETFKRLADEELGHEVYLRVQYRAVAETGAFDAQARLGTQFFYPGESPIFSPELVGRIGEAHFEMSALSIAIQLEINSIKHYQSAAEQVSDEAAKKVFAELANWETDHYQMLLRQQELVRDGYWQANGFAPF
ncbi:MAG: ferritin family protein [Deltaproteobacteria bacterium]|nr:ferritin family protein [Deltaproteobacteria bacterium]